MQVHFFPSQTLFFQIAVVTTNAAESKTLAFREMILTIMMKQPLFGGKVYLCTESSNRENTLGWILS